MRAEAPNKSGQDAEIPRSVPGVAQRPLDSTLSFLFVVNNLVISELDRTGADIRGIMQPPQGPDSYASEIPSPVFRYQDGRVTTLSPQRYTWYREPPNDRAPFSDGSISGLGHDPVTNQNQWQKLPVYRTYTVFRGWHFQPVVFMGCDALTTPVDDLEMSTSKCLNPQ